MSSVDLEDEIGGRKEETLLLESIVREKTAQIAALVSELEVLQGISSSYQEYHSLQSLQRCHPTIYGEGTGIHRSLLAGDDA